MKKELIEKIMSMTHPTQDLAYIGKGYLKQILEEELPDFSRIDEERFKRIYASKVCDIGLHIKECNSTLQPALKPLPKEMPKEYNSLATPYQVWLQVQQEYGTPANNLQPLPKEMPKDLTRFAMGHDVDEVWDKIISEYGTAEPKQPLPTVEELAKEIESHGTKIFSFSVESIAKNLHDKYSLHASEWWQDLKEGDKFKLANGVMQQTFVGFRLKNTNGEMFDPKYCTPYTPPSAQDIIAKHNLSEEEVKILREGK